MNINNLFSRIAIALLSVVFFWALESGFSLRNGDELIKSLIFAATLFVSFTNKHRRYLLIISMILLVVMIISYLFWQIPSATFFGSLGFGMFFIYIISFIPDFIKRGFVD